MFSSFETLFLVPFHTLELALPQIAPIPGDKLPVGNGSELSKKCTTSGRGSGGTLFELIIALD